MNRKNAHQSTRRVMVVDDHAIVRKGVVEMVNAEKDFCVVSEAESASQALVQLETGTPDAAVVDISLQDRSGISLIRDLVSRSESIAILALSMHDEASYAERVLHAGALGYVSKAEPAEQIVSALRAVVRREVYVSPRIASRILRRLAGTYVSEGYSGTFVDALSDRQLEVFELIGRGLKTGEIAKRLHLSVKTIDTHRENIKRRLQISSASELVRCAIRWSEANL